MQACRFREKWAGTTRENTALPREKELMPDLLAQFGIKADQAETVLTHGSLFTGIGGMDRGLEQAGFVTLWQVENASYNLKVLNRRWPKVQKFTDVRECGKHNLARVDIISGGFPCQDVSAAGKGRGLGTPDNPTERSGLWFEFRRIVDELRPPWVLAENVYRLKSNGADRVLADLEALNYTCWPIVVGAENFGAPQERKRLWVLCRSNDAGFA